MPRMIKDEHSKALLFIPTEEEEKVINLEKTVDDLKCLVTKLLNEKGGEVK